MSRTLDLATLDLAGLVGSRLCHDLISPVGAIGNGLELLELSGVAPSEEMHLIRASVEAATARISFFRIAFGATKGTQSMSPKEIKTVLDATYRDSRITLVWDTPDSQPRSEVRLAFLALACLETAMPWGGTIEVRRTHDAWVLHARAERLKIDSGLWDLLRRGSAEAEITGGTVQFGLLAQSAQAGRRPVSVTQTDTSLSLLV
jgi:histidine phosphotransferase ChpT